MSKQDFQQRITEFVEVITQEIVNSSLSDLEKLGLIDKNKLWPIGGCIQHPFDNTWQYKKLDSECEAKHGYSIIDDYFHLGDVRNRGSIVSIVDEINYIIENKDEYANKILILQNRSDPINERVYVPVDECIQMLIDFCFKKKMTSFFWDW